MSQLLKQVLRHVVAVLGLIAAAAGPFAAGAVWYAHSTGMIPPGDDPWARFDLTAEPGFFTGRQIARLRDRPAECFAALDKAGISYRRLPNQPLRDGCGLADALVWTHDAPRLASGLQMTCPLAAATALTFRAVIQPAAERYLHSRIVRVEDFGTYACRNIRSTEPSERRSEHARGNALDLAGFVTAQGREVSVAGNWGANDPASSFLKAVRSGACGIFRVVLSPDYNALHHDHLHLDMGPFSACR